MWPWWSLSALFLPACQVVLIAGNSGPCCMCVLCQACLDSFVFWGSKQHHFQSCGKYHQRLKYRYRSGQVVVSSSCDLSDRKLPRRKDDVITFSLIFLSYKTRILGGVIALWDAWQTIASSSQGDIRQEFEVCKNDAVAIWLVPTYDAGTGWLPVGCLVMRSWHWHIQRMSRDDAIPRSPNFPVPNKPYGFCER